MGVVEELRELSRELSQEYHLRGGVPSNCWIYKRFTGIGISDCTDTMFNSMFCVGHQVAFLDVLANRIEEEYGKGEV